MITKEIVAELSDENITKKRYAEITQLIASRVDEIWRFIIKATPGRSMQWWAFSNDVDLGNGNGSTGGEFDPVEDAEFIVMIGDNSEWSNQFYAYNNGFPTEFLWLDYQAIVKQHIKDAKKKLEKYKFEKANKMLEKENAKNILKQSIESKLTKEELKLIKFK